jgi:hypothetical protein
MEDLLSYNEGLPSRFPSQFTFEDYSDAELLEIFKVQGRSRAPAHFTLCSSNSMRLP